VYVQAPAPAAPAQPPHQAAAEVNAHAVVALLHNVHLSQHCSVAKRWIDTSWLYPAAMVNVTAHVWLFE